MKFSNKLFFLFIGTAMSIGIACNNGTKKHGINPQNKMSTRLDSTLFDTVLNDKTVKIYFLKNSKNIQAAITNYGGRLVSLLVPDKTGQLTDVVMGYGNIKDFVTKGEGFYGAIVGRYGNRIADGIFTLNDVVYQLSQNNGLNTLHGGKDGFHKQIWRGKKINGHTLELTYLSENMEQGFPGNLNVTVIYELTENNELKISYKATTDKETVVNLTNHTYFNLNGKGSILDHSLWISADLYTPVNSALIPTGKLEPVKNSPFDFTQTKTIGKDIKANNIQLERGKGYDHNFALRKSLLDMGHAATVYGDQSGIVMTIYTQEPGVQFYSGNFMKGKNVLKNNIKDNYRTAFCLEPQHFPDSPNRPSFPSTVLNPGKVYKTSSLYRFSIIRD